MAAVAPSVAPKTLGEALAGVAPGRRWRHLIAWPPDAFAAAAVVLCDTGGYRFAVAPPAGSAWPPATGWDATVRSAGERWASSALTRGGRRRGRRPRILLDIATRLDASRSVALEDLTAGTAWDVVCDLLSLVAMADEACAGIELGNAVRLPFHMRARTLLHNTGSLSSLAQDRVRVLPKLRVPKSGITVRSLTRYLAMERSEVATEWRDNLPAFSPPPDPPDDHFTLLLVPWPSEAYPAEFKTRRGPLKNMDPEGFGFFEYEPATTFDPPHVIKLVGEAQRRIGRVDGVVFPEAVLTPADVNALEPELQKAGVMYLIAGVRKPAAAGGLGENYAYLGGLDPSGAPWHIEQHKHHRWFLDGDQIERYHLGPALDPNLRWWEAIDVRPRRLTFVTIRQWLTICPLVCEDLARPDPVANLIRAVGPSLVIALLLDGPQLASRWPARYATVLADDPGSAVLTLSSLGLVERSRPAGERASRVIGLWKDTRGVPRELDLEPGAEALALTVSVRASTGTTADGREETATETSDLFLSGVEQIRL